VIKSGALNRADAMAVMARRGHIGKRDPSFESFRKSPPTNEKPAMRSLGEKVEGSGPS
jgi:hypothetical protein